MSQPSELNRYYATRPSYQAVILTPNTGSSFALGDGLDMSNPDRPVGRPLRAFPKFQALVEAAALDGQDIANSDVIDGTNSSYVENISVAEESRILFINFSASYGFSNASAAYSEAYSRKDTHKTVYVLLDNLRTGPALAGQDLTWKSAPASEKLATLEERLTQLVEDYGSHYIAAVNYGFRIAIRASLSETDEERRKAFSIAIQAEFGALSAAGGASAEQKSMLKTSSVEIRAVVNSGGLSPPHATVLFGYEQVLQFLVQLRAGSISVKRAPISVNVNSYRHTLSSYPKTREAAEPFNGHLVTAPFGVPRGTVLPWVPQQNDLRTDNGVVSWKPPEGWVLCDGTQGTPNLINRFIRGAMNTDQTAGGQENHTHQVDLAGAIRSPESNTPMVYGLNAPQMWHTHLATVSSVSNMPPFVSLLYIMKL